jgi:hypothetical protein
MVPSYPKTPHWPASLSVHRDDHYHTDPEWFVGRQVIITEKLDGGITLINQGDTYARSSQKPTSLPWFTYVKSVTVPKLYGVAANLIPIGEDLYGIHSIEYDPLMDTFYLFHVLDRDIANMDDPLETKNDVFWSWCAVKEFASVYGINHVPVLFEGAFDSSAQITEWFNDHIKEPSRYGPVQEGFVMRAAEGFGFDHFATNVAKFVRAKHVQTDEHWTKNWKPARLLKRGE